MLTALCFAAVLYGLTNFASVTPSIFKDMNGLFFWVRMVMFTWMGTIMALVFFAYTFPSYTFDLPKKKAIGIFVWMFGMMILGVTPFVFSGMIVKDNIPAPVPNIGLVPYAITALGGIVWAGILFLKKGRRLVKTEPESTSIKCYILLSLTAFVYFFGQLIFNFIVVNAFKNSLYVQYGMVWSVPFIVAAAYAVAKRYEALKIHWVLSQLLIIAMMFLLFVNIFLPY